MIQKFTSQILIILCFIPFAIVAQEGSIESGSNAGINSIAGNSASNPCITSQQYESIERRCNQNIRILNNGRLQRFSSVPTQFIWPLQPAVDLHDYSYYFVSAYVDQNTSVGNIGDFNCGTNTYDGHKGTDIAIFPFAFYKMDNLLVEVIAAAPGTIVDKSDGNFDRNCASTNMTANYVVIQHADGSYVLYWHMKSGSITTKAIGQTVVAGEYLGIVGSSGSSSGPHLHFEAWSGSTSATYNDPFSGNCNLLNNNSWWVNQKPYTEPAVIKVSVNTTDIVLPGCPNTETPNESNSFTVPFQGQGLPAGYAKFYIFIRNETNGMVATCKILNPNGSTFSTWTYNSTSNTKAKTWGWSKVLPTNPGVYTFEVTYNSIVTSKTFEITTTTNIAAVQNHSGINIYPNPSNGKINFDYDADRYSMAQIKNATIEFYNVLGKIVYQSNLPDKRSGINLDVHGGVYFYRVKDDQNIISSGRLVIE